VIEGTYNANQYVLYQGDCFELLDLPKADLVIADPPFGVEWFADFELSKLWDFYQSVLKEPGTIVLDNEQPYISWLIHSGRELFQHSLIWEKDIVGMRHFAGYLPLKVHTEFAVFSNGSFHPKAKVRATYNDGGPLQKPGAISGAKHAQSIFYHSVVHGDRRHPGQKPVGLLRWLIKQYSNPGDWVLDHVMGSGATGVAALLEGRNFIGIERDPAIFSEAVDWLSSPVTGETKPPASENAFF